MQRRNSMNAGKCSVCGYVDQGDEVPHKCPHCGAEKENFQLLGEDPSAKIEPSSGTNEIHINLLGLLD